GLRRERNALSHRSKPGGGGDTSHIGTPSPNSEGPASTKSVVIAVSFRPRITMVGNPRPINEGHFLMLNLGRSGSSWKGFRLLDVAWFQQIISGKRSGPGSNWRARKAGKP